MNYKFFKLIKNKIISRLNLLIEKFYNKNRYIYLKKYNLGKISYFFIKNFI